MAFYDTAGRDKVTPDPLLTNIGIEFAKNASEFIGGQLVPTINVTSQMGRYRLFGREYFRLAFGGDVRAPGTRANEIEGFFNKWAEDSYFAVEHALEMGIPDEEEENRPEDEPAPEAAATEDLVGKMLLAKEVAIRDMVYDTTQYKTNHVVTLGAGQQFDDYTNSDPVGVFRTAFRTFHADTGILPNLAVVPWTVFSYLEDHPKIVERYRAQGGVITAQQIMNLLGIQRALVPGSVYNANSNPGLTAAVQEIWGDNILLAYVPNRPGPRTPALGYEFLWRIPGGRGRRNQEGIVIDRRFDSDNIRDLVRARRRYDLKLVGRDPDLTGTPVVAGYLIRDVLSAAA